MSRPHWTRLLWRAAWRRKSALFAMLFLLILLLAALFSPYVAPKSPHQQSILKRLLPPTWYDGGHPDHILGTDHLGRDVLSRVIYGSRVSLGVGVSAMLVSALIGIPLGLWAGYRGGRADSMLMRLVDVQMAFPSILLALALIAVVGPNLRNLILVLGITGWADFARLVRAQALSLREIEYVAAARSLGASDWTILFRHILPNMTSTLLVVGTMKIATFIIAEAGLSFLGLGVPVAVPTWGGMLSDTRLYLFVASWLPTFPGLAILLTVLSINLVGDLFRDVFDPRLKT